MKPTTLRHEIRKKKPFDVPEEEAYLNVLRTAAALGGGFARLFRSAGLSESTYNVLRILRGHHPAGVPSQAIGPQMVTLVPDVTRLVDRLEEAGLAERIRTEQDRRVVLVRITKAGLDLLARLDRPVVELSKRQLGHLTRKELAELSRLLVKARYPGGDEGGAGSSTRGATRNAGRGVGGPE